MPLDRLRGQPQERQHSDDAAQRRRTRDRLPPARGSIQVARGIEADPIETHRDSVTRARSRNAGRAQH
jgi:hypothetical protein